MPATLLTDEPLTLTNAPRLSDIRTMTQLLQSLGAEVSTPGRREVLAHVLARADRAGGRNTTSCARCARRSSCWGRCWRVTGYAEVSLPGGCAIGARPVDLHLRALEAMGARWTCATAMCTRRRRRAGCGATDFTFPFVSVGATENALMAATLARGTTVLRNAAREPEIVDLARCLRGWARGSRARAGPTITIEGVDRLDGATHAVVTDRIELGTYMLAPRSAAAPSPALAAGSTCCAFCERLDAAGISVSEDARGLTVSRNGGGASVRST